MTEPVVFSRRPIVALVLLALAAAPLAACGNGRDAVLAEKVARAEDAARKAEEAARKAERAARAAGARLNEVNAARNGEGSGDDNPSVAVGDNPPETPIDTANASHEQSTDFASALNMPVR